MAYEVKLPRLGWDMEEGSLAGWIKQAGEYVNAGEMLFSVEGDKAVQEIEAIESGFLRIPPDAPQPGQKVPVGTLLGYLVPKEEIEGYELPGSPPAPPAPIETKSSSNPGMPAAQMLGLEPPQPPDGRKHRIYISPYAKRLAQSLGVDWQYLNGSGLNGRIMAHDVQEAAAQRAAPGVASPTSEAITAVQAPMRLPMTQIRRKIAEHLAYSAHTSAPVTLNTEADATELVVLRNALKNDSNPKELSHPSYNDLLAKIVAQALLEHPMLNARIEGDEVVQSPSVHIAIAVDTERGLIVPVLRDVQNKTLRQIARESSVLIEKTRNGSIRYEDLRGATFTITNLGMFEIDTFTPIIDLPQCAILGVGRILPKQVVVDVVAGEVAIRQLVFLSLTFDHRLVDGAQAARFLQRVKHFIETPYLWMAG
jgi:pyruvate dehydrogenase E2 component (dihydrolipoamide acetyltransferase)